MHQRIEPLVRLDLWDLLSPGEALRTKSISTLCHYALSDGTESVRFFYIASMVPRGGSCGTSWRATSRFPRWPRYIGCATDCTNKASSLLVEGR